VRSKVERVPPKIPRLRERRVRRSRDGTLIFRRWNRFKVNNSEPGRSQWGQQKRKGCRSGIVISFLSRENLRGEIEDESILFFVVRKIWRRRVKIGWDTHHRREGWEEWKCREKGALQ